MINSFLLIGQSNMAGRGNLLDTPEIINADVLMFRQQEWQVAKEPIHQDKDIAGVGLAASFGDALQKKYKKQIGFIPCAVGGSSLDEWAEGEKFYTAAVNTATEALKTSTLKGILWHQGEADSGSTENVNSYEKRFQSFLSSLMRDIGVQNVPVILGELGTFLRSPYWKELNQVFHSIALKNSGIEIVTSENLTDGGDSLHFNSISLREFGHRYADAWEACSNRIGISLF